MTRRYTVKVGIMGPDGVLYEIQPPGGTWDLPAAHDYQERFVAGMPKGYSISVTAKIEEDGTGN